MDEGRSREQGPTAIGGVDILKKVTCPQQAGASASSRGVKEGKAGVLPALRQERAE